MRWHRARRHARPRADGHQGPRRVPRDALSVEHDAYEHHDGGPSILWRATGDSSARVIDGLRALSPIIVPLSLEATRQCHDEELFPERFTRHVEHTGFRLVSADASAQAEVFYVGDHPHRVERIDDETLLAWLRGLEGPCPVEPNHRVLWEELRVTSSRVPVVVAERIRVRAAERPGLVHALCVERIAGETWVTTPTEATRAAIMRPPLGLSFTFTYGCLEAALALNWSSWTKDTDGVRAIREADERMKKAGFETDEESYGRLAEYTS